MVLIESIHKKAVFLQQARIELKLENVEVAAVRVEQYHPPTEFDSVVFSCFFRLGGLRQTGWAFVRGWRTGRQALGDEGLVSARGTAELPGQFLVEKILSVAVPGLESERHLVVIKRVEAE